ncbi:MAG: ABC transporter substrate-binding protein [Clostridia bacterium]|nr:ABC transporter substrate-binding protein [Clostridia bacterium]
MKRLSALLIALILVISCSAAIAEDTVKIGMLTVLTGDRATEGEYAMNAMEIAVEEINAAGGVLGKPLEIVVEDALGTDVGAVNAFRKMAADPDICAIIGTNSSNDAIATSSSVLEAQIVTTAQGSNPVLMQICNEENPWMFQLRACDITLCTALMKYAVEELGVKSFVVLHDTDSSSANQAALFTEALASYDIKPLLDIPFTTGTKDFSSHLAQIQNSGAEAVVVSCFHTEAAIILQQMQALEMEQPVFGSNAFGDPITIGLAGDAINGAYSAAGWVPNTPNPIGAALSAKYEERFGAACASSASQVYDHIYVLCEAIKRAGSTDRAAIRDAMNTISDYQGAITVYDCRTNGDCGRGGLLVQVVDQQPTIIQELYSEKVID